MDEQSKIPENIENYILNKEILLRELARKEAEKARNQTVAVLTSVALIIGVLGTIGIIGAIKTVTQKAVEKQVGSEFLNRAKKASEEIEFIKINAEKSLERIYEVEKQICEEDWIDVRFENNWTNYGGTYNPCGYIKDELGRIYLRGLVKNGNIKVPIFKLPDGYRPIFKELFIARTGNTSTRVDVNISGEVIVTNTYSSWVSLDGISFSSAIMKDLDKELPEDVLNEEKSKLE